MNTGNENGIGRKRMARSMMLAGAALAALILAAQVPAEAHGKHGHHPRHGAAHAYPYYPSSGAVYVPRRFYAPDAVTYRPWFAGQVYYGPHRHYHASYRFPVMVDGAVVYRPYAYCDDRLFVSATIPVPRLVIGFNLGPDVAIHGETSLPPGGYGYRARDDED